MNSEAGKKLDAPDKETPQIRIVFMGTPEFATMSLERLLADGYNVVAVYTRPDKPVGRDKELIPSPVKTLAGKHHIPLEQPVAFDEAAIATLKGYRPDLIVISAFGRILPAAVLGLPGFGCLNIHASVLPRWRGASPIQNALLSGDVETGVSIMLLDEGLDTGPILATERIAIDPDDTTQTLTPKLAEIGVRLIARVIPQWVGRRIEPVPQPADGVTLCQLIEREDGHIFWTATAADIYNRFRAFYPWPGIFTYRKRGHGEFDRIKLHKISFLKAQPAVPKKPGEVFEFGEHVAIQTGEGVILVEEIQVSGKDRVTVRDFLNGSPDFLGDILD